MLDQLHFYRDKTFPGRRFSTDWHFRDGSYHPHHLHPHHHHHHKHSPMSARPIRPTRQPTLLNRPKTSATLYRKNIEEEETNNTQTKGSYNIPQPNLNSNYEILIDSNGRHVASVTTEQKIDLSNANQTSLRDQDFRQSTELPPIKVNNNNNNNKENVQPFVDNLNKDNLTRDIQPSAFANKNEMDRDIVRTAPQQAVDRNNNYSFPSQNTPPQQRRGSLRLNSFNEPVPSVDDIDKDVNNNNNNNNNFLPDQAPDPFSSSLTDVELEKEIKNIRVNEFLEKHANQEAQTQQEQQQLQQSQSRPNQQQPKLDNEALNQGVSAQLLETKLAEELTADETVTPDQPTNEGDTTTTVKPQKRLIRQNTKTNFNRISKNEPAPLRHNITSVLRQERTKFEASQKKVKDYLHTMGGSSKDNSTKHSTTTSREPSAHSRKSTMRKSIPNA